MKATDYKELIQALDYLTTGMHGADTLRAVFEKHTVEAPAGEREPGEPATVDEPIDQARQHPLFKDRMLLLHGASKTVDDVAHKMQQLVDGFVEENQGRADQGVGPTTDGRALFNAMSRFMSATDTPIPGARTLYDWNHVVTVKTKHDGGVFSRDVFVHGVRTQCREWMDRLVAWFPDLNPGKTTDQAGNPRPMAPGMSDREMLMEQSRAKVLASNDYKLAKDNKHITAPWTWNDTISELVEWLDTNGFLNKDTNGRYMWTCWGGVFLNHKTREPITARQLSDASKEINRKAKR